MPEISDVRDEEFERRFLALHELPSPRAARLLARLLVYSFVAVALFLALAPWQQSATGEGRVVAYAPTERQQTVDAPVEGRIVRWHVREGSVVKAGDVLVELSDLDPSIMARLREERDAIARRRDAAQQRATELEGRIEALTGSRGAAVDAARSRAKMAADRVRAAEQALAAAEAAVRTTQLNYDRQRALTDKGLSATRALELAELDRVRATTDADRARAALGAARSEELALRSDLDKTGNDAGAALADARAGRASALAEVASAGAELARIEVRLSRQASQAVQAPRAGTILRLLANPGAELVKGGDPLALLVPNTDERAVELWVDGNDAPLLSEGREVRLQFEGWPAIQFTGWPSVAVGSFGGRVMVIDATDNGKGKFRVLVVPDGKEPWPSGRYLRQGVRATGWVLLGRVRLGYELWRQLNGFPPVVATEEPDSAGGKKKEAK